MEKLIELLKDQYGEVVTYNIQSDGGYMFHISGFAVREERLLSKKFGFVKWLIENDKIRLPHELDELPQIYGVDYNSNECKSDRLIMLLSISNSPIEDLISYLR